MRYLFNSRGQHIANEVNGQLHDPSGKNIGHFIDMGGIFIDMNGQYLGEILYDDRLVSRDNSPYRSMNFGNYGNYGNAGNYGDPGNSEAVGLPSGYRDIEPKLLA